MRCSRIRVDEVVGQKDIFSESFLKEMNMEALGMGWRGRTNKQREEVAISIKSSIKEWWGS